MNIKSIIFVLSVFGSLIAVVIMWYLFVAPEDTAEQFTLTPTLPISELTNGTVSSPTETRATIENVMQITSQDGSIVVTNDFINKNSTIPDEANPGIYMLAVSEEYCQIYPQNCRVAPAKNYIVHFDTNTYTFNIILTEDPIGIARLDMENFLKNLLGISEAQMCSLNYRVGVTSYVNEHFSGRNLGFSFCPGAVKLPQ